MAMVIQNNMAAVNSLNTLNKNSSALAKSLQQISSGQKINSAGDNASYYAISERMRVHIRGLSQDIDNTQTGNSLLKVADGAIQSITDNLREMKRMAIDAANDTNTDADRLIIQKEFNERKNQIDDIASTTNYNGKILLDGRYRLGVLGVSDPTVAVVPMGKDVKYDPNHPIDNATRLPGLFQPENFTLDKAGDPIHCSYSTPDTLQGEMFYAPVLPHGNSPQFPGASAEVNVKIDFFPNGGMTTDLNGKGFTIGCAGCWQDVAVIFSGSADVGTGQRIVGHRADSGKETFAYIIGVKGVSTAGELMDAVFNGAKAAGATVSGTDFRYGDGLETVELASEHHVRITKKADGYYWRKNNRPYRTDTSALLLTDGFEGKLDGGEMTQPMGYAAPLIIHTGTKANQHIKLYLSDMHAESLGIDGAEVATRDKAVASLASLDGAIQYTLDEATRVGAYMHRMDITRSNLTVAHENVTASESVVRDVDMASAMTEYTKHNVLLSAAQSMLAQANQNSSAVMSLLQ